MDWTVPFVPQLVTIQLSRHRRIQIAVSFRTGTSRYTLRLHRVHYPATGTKVLFPVLIECKYFVFNTFVWLWTVSDHVPGTVDSKRIDSGNYQCTECGRRFRGNWDLQRHFRSHSGERPFECAICGAKYKYKSNLKCHQLIHFGNKKYQCSQCKKRFLRKSDCTKHLKTHRSASQSSPRVDELWLRNLFKYVIVLTFWIFKRLYAFIARGGGPRGEGFFVRPPDHAVVTSDVDMLCSQLHVGRTHVHAAVILLISYHLDIL